MSMTVLISGLGIAGPTLAYWLLRSGFQPTLVERAPRLREGGYMIDFWGVGFDVAERMGLIPQLRRDSYDIQEVRFVNSSGRKVGGFDARVFRRALGDRYLSIMRADLSAGIYRSLDGEVGTLLETASPASTKTRTGSRSTSRVPDRGVSTS